MYAIYNTRGKVDSDPEPMVFETRREAMEMLNTGLFPSGYYVDSYEPPMRRKISKKKSTKKR